jgi:hypothetical protein
LRKARGLCFFNGQRFGWSLWGSLCLCEILQRSCKAAPPVDKGKPSTFTALTLLLSTEKSKSKQAKGKGEEALNASLLLPFACLLLTSSTSFPVRIRRKRR